MRHLLYAFAMIIGLTGAVRADEAAIQGVISSQIDAFKADDFATAFTYASPTIQGVFRTPERFGLMVREGYPMVWRPAEMRFLDQQVIDGELWQNVLIRDAEGQEYLLGYQMVEGADGWKINAVRVEKAAAGMAQSPAPRGGLSFG
ncbi:DUF4864 domain-containing protein [Roseovarius faecimaris]|uniref:DUF4864 domain-containing protein n=2 Tax=Roseovarius faecimaris TaxID=2494550 RepID=A0A6I6IXX7_9RHOB|nr:DUF4864 domain-containing protein [Roseovarius faecimaris]